MNLIDKLKKEKVSLIVLLKTKKTTWLTEAIETETKVIYEDELEKYYFDYGHNMVEIIARNGV